MKRVFIYTFWEKDGVLREHVKHYLNALLGVSENVFVVVNGKIDNAGISFLKACKIKYFIRDNKGFDFSAWKHAIDSLTFSYISKFDELILCNCSVYGPFYPLNEMFDKMRMKKCDFWGVSYALEDRNYLLNKKDRDSYIRAHLQSYFLVFRKNVIISDVFKKWWDSLEESKTYMDEVFQHETKFTEYLVNFGFKVGYVYKGNFNWNVSIFEANKMLLSGVPFVKRKLFYVYHNKFVSNVLLDVYDYLAANKCASIIFEDLSDLNSLGLLLKTIRLRYFIRFRLVLLFVKYLTLSLLTRDKMVSWRYNAMKIIVFK